MSDQEEVEVGYRFAALPEHSVVLGATLRAECANPMDGAGGGAPIVSLSPREATAVLPKCGLDLQESSWGTCWAPY